MNTGSQMWTHVYLSWDAAKVVAHLSDIALASIWASLKKTCTPATPCFGQSLPRYYNNVAIISASMLHHTIHSSTCLDKILFPNRNTSSQRQQNATLMWGQHFVNSTYNLSHMSNSKAQPVGWAPVSVTTSHQHATVNQLHADLL